MQLIASSSPLSSSRFKSRGKETSLFETHYFLLVDKKKFNDSIKRYKTLSIFTAHRFLLQTTKRSISKTRIHLLVFSDPKRFMRWSQLRGLHIRKLKNFLPMLVSAFEPTSSTTVCGSQLREKFWFSRRLLQHTPKSLERRTPARKQVFHWWEFFSNVQLVELNWKFVSTRIQL